MNTIELSSTPSTNLYAKELLEKQQCESPTLITAIDQTSGRGQYGREFRSPPGGLYFSLILQPGLPGTLLPLITLATGLACAEIFEKLIQRKQVALKWPNDVYVNNKKLCGILCESVVNDVAASAWVIVGVGANVNSRLKDFPIDLQPLVTTLREETGNRETTDRLLKSLVLTIISHIKELKNNSPAILEKWQYYDYLYKQNITYNSGKKIIQGIGLGITSTGGYILVEASGKKHRIISGQIRKR